MIKNRHSFVSRNIISGNAITPQNRMKFDLHSPLLKGNTWPNVALGRMRHSALILFAPDKFSETLLYEMAGNLQSKFRPRV